MKLVRRANCTWEGTGKEGGGTISTQSKALDNTPFTFHTRFEDGLGASPEEFIGAAEAGCFTMKLSFLITGEGFTPGKLNCDAKVINNEGAITDIELKLEGSVPGMSEEKFNELANQAKEECTISQVLKANISLETSFS